MASADGEELSGWKEIAAYLQVDPRTARNWEWDRGLPVRRMPGTKRSVVYALRDELDCWKRSVKDDHPRSTDAGARRSYRWIALFALAMFAVLVVAISLWPQPGTAYTYRIENGNTLIILDENSDVLWQKVFQATRPDVGLEPGAKVIHVVDLTGDERREVLVAEELPNGLDAAVCYEAGGGELWRFVPGRTVQNHDEVFRPPFGVTAIAVTRSPVVRVAVASVHSMYFPTQVALLDGDGNLLGEYWHSGYLTTAEFADLNQDGRSELYLGGISNGTDEGTLVVLEPGNVRGASAESEPYQLRGFEEAEELARVFFPRTRLNQVLESKNEVAALRFTARAIVVQTKEHSPARGSGRVYYHLSSDLELEKATPNDQLLTYYRQYYQAGTIDKPWTAEDDSALRQIRVVKPGEIPTHVRPSLPN